MCPPAPCPHSAHTGTVLSTSPGTLQGTNLHPTHLFPLLESDLLLPRWTPEPLWPMAMDRHSVGRRSCPACLYLRCILPLQFLQSSPHLQVGWEQKGKTGKREYSQRVVLWLLHLLLTSILWPPHPHEPPLLHLLALLKPTTIPSLDRLTAPSQAPQPHTHTHTHQSPQISLKHLPLCIPLFLPAARHFGSVLHPPLPLVSEGACSPESNSSMKHHWDVQTSTGGFFACLQGCAGSHCKSFSGMTIETEEAWKEVGRLCLHQQLITVFGLLILWL